MTWTASAEAESFLDEQPASAAPATAMDSSVTAVERRADMHTPRARVRRDVRTASGDPTAPLSKLRHTLEGAKHPVDIGAAMKAAPATRRVAPPRSAGAGFLPNPLAPGRT
ncbi:hypothetical protein GCM10010440_54680 [Kitasatospora cinereorecta]